jgi:hypothetical protein
LIPDTGDLIRTKKLFDILEEVIEKKRRQQIGSCLALKDYRNKGKKVAIPMNQ